MSIQSDAMLQRPTRFRWVICGLLFSAAAINYIDRQVIGILKPTLQSQFQFDERDYASIVFTFQAAYAVGLLLSGRIMDRIGVRRGSECLRCRSIRQRSFS